MTTLISKATALLTGAATFAAAEIGAGALNLIRQAHSNSFPAAGTTTSSTFTVTSAKVIDGVVLYLKQLGGATLSTGTFKVDLQKGGVSQASVTVDKADLPANPTAISSVHNAPVFFKFTGTATGDGAANWTLVVTTTGVNTVYYSTHTAGATNWSRALRTTTNATAAANDDLYILGELTGSGTHTSYTVTMNSTAATAYGNGAVNSTTVNGGTVAVGNYGTLSYGTTASTNYIFRVAGDLRVFHYGTLNIGSSGAEIPRNSTAVLEFQQVSADADFGLIAHDYAVVNIAGLSRTSGKDVVKCKLTSDLVAANVLSAGSSTGLTSNSFTRDPEATGTSFFGASPQENTANTTHGVYHSGPSVTNVTQVASVWLAQGTGPANNRFVRVALGNNVLFTSITNGFWADLDLQLGTASAITNIGTGVGTSATIVASGAGWLVKLAGKVATTAATPSFLLNACSAAGTVTYLGASNFNFIYDHIGLVTAASLADTTFNVNADTGWLSGDVVCVSSTTRTPAEATLYPLNANAGASSFTSALYQNNVQQSIAAFAFTTSGTSPTQTSIGLVNRNIKIRSTSTVNMAYVYGSAWATMTVSWAEFYRMGTFTVGKRGVEIDSCSIAGLPCNPKSFTYCSFHDFENAGLTVSAAGSLGVNTVYSNNVNWNMPVAYNMAAAQTPSDWTVDNNLAMRGSGYAFSLSDVGGVCTNNIACSGVGQYGFALFEVNGTVGTFNNNTAFSSTGGLFINATGLACTIDNFTAWRMSGNGSAFNLNSALNDAVFNNLILFGNNLNHMSIGYDCPLTFNGGTISGDTTFPTTNGLSYSTVVHPVLVMNNVDMSGVGSIFAPHTGTDILVNNYPCNLTARINDCKFGAPTLVSKANLGSGANVGFGKLNQVAGDHRCEMGYGQLKLDAVVYNTLAPSMRMTPSSVNKLESAPDNLGVKIPVALGGAITAGVSLKPSNHTDLNIYTGNPPRLIVRTNAALGIDTDTVLATATLTPTTVTAFWDSASAVFCSLSGGNLVATITFASGTTGCWVVDSAGGKTSGKHYWECGLNFPTTPSGPGIGICTPTSTFTTLGNNATVGVIMYTNNGNIWVNGVNTGITIGARATGNVIGIASDLTNRLAWFRVAPAGNWNGNPAADPALGIGGVPIPAGFMTPVISGGNIAGTLGDVFTGNFGASAFVGAVPSGFTSGWLVTSNTGVWSTLSGTTPVATDDGVLEFIVDCDGLAGFINLDDWTFAGAATTASGMKNWYNGMPVIGGGGGASGFFSGGFT